MYKYIHIHVSKQTRQLPRVLPSLFLTFFPPLSLSYPPIPSPGLEGKNKRNKKVPLLWKFVTFPWEESSKWIAFLPPSCLSHPTPSVREEHGPWLPAPVMVREARGVKNRAAAVVITVPRTPGLTTVSSWELPTWCLGFLFVTKGVNFKDSCKTWFIYIKHSAQSQADGSRDLSVWGETHSTKATERGGGGAEAEKGGPSLGFLSTWLDDACGNTAPVNSQSRSLLLPFRWGIWRF